MINIKILLLINLKKFETFTKQIFLNIRKATFVAEFETK